MYNGDRAHHLRSGLWQFSIIFFLTWSSHFCEISCVLISISILLAFICLVPAMGIEESEDADSIENDVGLHLDFLGQRERVGRVDFRPYYFF